MANEERSYQIGTDFSYQQTSRVPNCEKGRYSFRASEENTQAYDIAETQAKQASRDIQVQMWSCDEWFQTKSGNQCILHLFSSN